jgi:hypothetical protein
MGAGGLKYDIFRYSHIVREFLRQHVNKQMFMNCNSPFAKITEQISVRALWAEVPVLNS